MSVILLEPKTKSIAYNIALMKWARYYEEREEEYLYIRGMFDRKYFNNHIGFTPDKIYMSCIFSFYSKLYEKTIDHYHGLFPNAEMIIGGVFPSLNPDWFKKDKWSAGIFGEDWLHIHQGRHSDIEHLVPKYNCKKIDHEYIFGTDRQKEQVKRKAKVVPLYTSRGCVNKCGYCAVPKLEGNQVNFSTIRPHLEVIKKEMPDTKNIVLYDNNFTEQTNIKQIVKDINDFDYGVDIHGLHVEAFTPEFAKEMAKLKIVSQSGVEATSGVLRFSFDKMKYEPSVWKAMDILTKSEIKAEFFCYMLYNWIDSPEDFFKRLIVAHNIAHTYKKIVFLFPQRYEPFMALEKGNHIGGKWDADILKGLRNMINWTHGFIGCSRHFSAFRWFGYDVDEFKERCLMYSDNKIRIEKKTEPIPDFDTHFLTQI